MPAPPGGLTVTVISSAPNVLAVEAPGTAEIPAGQTSGQITVTGVAGGAAAPAFATVRATGPGFADGTQRVGVVSSDIISLPSTLTVGLGQTSSVPVSLGRIAPAGGVAVSLESNEPDVLAVLTPSVTVPAGSQAANGQVRGAGAGTATLTASSPNFESDTSAVTVAANLNILQPSVPPVQVFPAPSTTAIDVRLEVAGSPAAAPSPITITLESSNSACVTATSPVTIETGVVSTTAQLSAVPGATLGCTAVVTATAPGIASDTVNTTVVLPPALTLGGFPRTLGAGLQTSACCGVFLAVAAPPEGVTIQVTSSDPTKVLLVRDGVAPGVPTLDLLVGAGESQSVPFGMQALEAAASSSVTVTATAPGYTAAAPGAVMVVQPALMISGLPPSATTLSQDLPFQVSIGVPRTDNSMLATPQPVRTGGTLKRATISNSVASVGRLVTATGPGQTVTIDIAVGQFSSPSTVAGGGVAFDPLAAGTTRVSASIPEFVATDAAAVDVNVTAPSLTFQGVATVGAGLQTQCCSVNLGTPAPAGGMTVQVASSDPTRVLVTPNATTPGAGTQSLTIAAGATSASFIVQGLEAVSTFPAMATLTASAPGVSNATLTATVVQPAVDIIGLPGTIPTTSDIPFQVQVGIGGGNGGTEFVGFPQAVRIGGSSKTATVSKPVDAVGQLVTATSTGHSVTTQIAPGQATSPPTVPAGGVAFRVLSSGSTGVTAAIPGFLGTTAASQPVTVTVPSLAFFGLFPTRVGAGLQQQAGVVRLSTAAPAAGVTVRVTTGDSTKALLSPDAFTAGTPTLDLFIAAGRFDSTSIFIHGTETLPSEVTITATAPGYAPATTTANIVQPALQIIDLPAATTTLSPNSPFRIQIGIPDTSNTRVERPQAVRIGGVAKTATVSKPADTVGSLVTNGGAGSSVTVNIAAGQSSSPATVVAGGVAFDPLSTGSTTVSATIPSFIATPAATNQPISVTAPSLAMHGLPATVGAGLQQSVGVVQLETQAPAGGATVRVTSSDPSKILVSSGAAVPGTASIDLAVAAGQTATTTFFIQGVETASPLPSTVSITATATGFLDASRTAMVEQPGLQIEGLPGTISRAAADDPFIVRVGLAGGGTFVGQPQAVRAGGPAKTVTISNASANVAQLATSSATGQTVTIMIVAGQSSSAGTVASDGVAFDPLEAGSTTVTATIPGFIATTAASRAVTVTAP